MENNKYDTLIQRDEKRVVIGAIMEKDFMYLAQVNFDEFTKDDYANESATEIVNKLNSFDALQEQNRLLTNVLQAILDVINRSDTALIHYGEAIQKGEKALSNNKTLKA